jgi:hypothetical protein
MNDDDNPICYSCLDNVTKATLREWISLYIRPAETPYTRARLSKSTPLSHFTSSGLRDDFWSMTGIYVTNGAFKGAMLAAGYHPADPQTLNWIFYMRPAPLICPSCGRQVRIGKSCKRPRLGDLCSECRKARARTAASARLQA